MSAKDLDLCGQLLMHEARDRAVDQWNRVLTGQMRDQESQKLFASLDQKTREVIQELVPKIVDACMHYSLCLFDSESELRLALRNDAGELTDVATLSDGLPGELYTEDGWIHRFATGTLHGD